MTPSPNGSCCCCAANCYGGIPAPSYMPYAPSASQGALRPSTQASDRVYPLFRGALPPDVTFLGFPLQESDVRGQPGWFFVIQQQPGEPQFGLDAPTSFGGAAANLNALSWGHLVSDAAALTGLASRQSPAWRQRLTQYQRLSSRCGMGQKRCAYGPHHLTASGARGDPCGADAGGRLKEEGHHAAIPLTLPLISTDRAPGVIARAAGNALFRRRTARARLSGQGARGHA